MLYHKIYKYIQIQLAIHFYMQKKTINGNILTPQSKLVSDNVVVYGVDKVLLSSGGMDLNGVLDSRKAVFSNTIQAIQLAGAAEVLEGPLIIFTV